MVMTVHRTTMTNFNEILKHRYVDGDNIFMIVVMNNHSIIEEALLHGKVELVNYFGSYVLSLGLDENHYSLMKSVLADRHYIFRKNNIEQNVKATSEIIFA